MMNFKKMMLALGLMGFVQTGFAAEQVYTLERSSHSSQSCFDFIFGMSGSTQNYIKTVRIIGNDEGMAIGFDTKEIGDVSDLKTKFKVIAPATYQVFKGKSHQARFTTGTAGYVHWAVVLSDKVKKQRVLSTASQEGFGTGKSVLSTCTLIEQ